MVNILENQLRDYAAGRLYPLHMPGHKRRLGPAEGLPYGWDLTEVDGVDDLHEAEGILKEAMERTAELWGAEKSWYLVNGSTCGLLAGIRALAPRDSEILVARNCHKAVYHAIELGNLRAHWVVPPVDPDSGVFGSLSPVDIQKALEAFPGIRCVVLTSPTYEGVLSDIKTIAEICHRFQVPLLVDEAHGAHLGFSTKWPDSALHLGADLVVQSAHKTLPSLTQTAFLHLSKGSLADPEEVERQLDVFETSSPSYPLLVSLDSCTGLMAKEGPKLLDGWISMLEDFDTAIAGLQKLRVLGHGGDRDHPGFFNFDPGKLPVLTAGTQFTGTSLAARFRNDFAFETEMACGNLALAMTSMADEPEAILRFAEALHALDREAILIPKAPVLSIPAPGPCRCTIGEAMVQASINCHISQAAGRISAEYVWAYPPGIPMIAPGEVITQAFLVQLRYFMETGTRIFHSHCKIIDHFRVFA